MPTVEGCRNRKMGEWYDALPPLAHCSGNAGLVDYFGRKLVRKLPEEIIIGAAVVAVSSSNIHLYDKEGYQYYADSVNKDYYQKVEIGKKAQKDGVIKGILFHLEENNARDKNWPNYVKRIYENILKDLGLVAKDVPLFVGEVVCTEEGGIAGKHNAVVNTVPNYIPTAHVISSKGLKPRPDNIHFSNEAYVTLGKRYADEVLKVVYNKNRGSNTNANNNSTTKNNKPVRESVDGRCSEFEKEIIICPNNSCCSKYVVVVMDQPFVVKVVNPLLDAVIRLVSQ